MHEELFKTQLKFPLIKACPRFQASNPRAAAHLEGFSATAWGLCLWPPPARMECLSENHGRLEKNQVVYVVFLLFLNQHMVPNIRLV